MNGIRVGLLMPVHPSGSLSASVLANVYSGILVPRLGANLAEQSGSSQSLVQLDIDCSRVKTLVKTLYRDNVIPDIEIIVLYRDNVISHYCIYICL